ncbi:hypothetical protein [Phytoactinopolyspora endophytica]|uniref:hypothetical protein n=1 Tax=Phytoactinopolyspora endophytica TaxID=1642495 RepID=UPI00101BF3FB|nr:hypothetical protein [Phytoactinopolyspora endophytica]
MTALVVKAVERTGERAADGAGAGLARLVEGLRGRLSKPETEAATAALGKLEEVPDSPSRMEELAAALDHLTDADPQLRGELEALVTESQQAGVEVGSVLQTAWGNQNVQVAGASNSDIRVNYGQSPPSNP